MARIESHFNEWHILALGLSITTMEEVFLKVSQLAEDKLKESDEKLKR